MEIHRTKSGLPALWERGGGSRNTGRVTIVADSKGRPKRPIYIKRRGHLANGDHALFVVKVGDLVITADHHRRDFNVQIHRITSIKGDTAELELVNEFSEGQWDNDNKYPDAVQAAMDKATCYHCREPHYVGG